MSASLTLDRLLRRRVVTLTLVFLLALVATIPLAALWRAFGPSAAPKASDLTLIDQDGHPFTLSAERVTRSFSSSDTRTAAMLVR